jgi:hypothetical protein
VKLLYLFVVMLGLFAFGCEARREAEPVRPEGGVEAPAPAEGEHPAAEKAKPTEESPPEKKAAP